MLPPEHFLANDFATFSWEVREDSGRYQDVSNEPPATHREDEEESKKCPFRVYSQSEFIDPIRSEKKNSTVSTADHSASLRKVLWKDNLAKWNDFRVRTQYDLLRRLWSTIMNGLVFKGFSRGMNRWSGVNICTNVWHMREEIVRFVDNDCVTDKFFLS